MNTNAALNQSLETLKAAPIAGEATQYLTFTVGGEEYGVDIMLVREVKGWSLTTRLPNTPPYMRGVLNLRGIIIPIFDLRARLGGELTEATEKHVVVILAVGNRTIGILVDTVSDILSITGDDIKPAPENDGAGRYVSGLIAVEERMVVLLDINQLLLSENLDALTLQNA